MSAKNEEALDGSRNEVSLPQKGYLSQQVFSNPQDFLKTLRDDFPKLSYGNDVITKQALQEYIAHGEDPKTKAAALIASDHFNTLAKINDWDSGITMDNLDFAQSEINNSMSKYISDNKIAGLTLSGLPMVVGTGYGAGVLRESLTQAEEGRPVPAIACGLAGIGILAGGWGIGTMLGKAAYDENRRLHEGVRRDVIMLNQWFAR
jgi:hypothetical protein